MEPDPEGDAVEVDAEEDSSDWGGGCFWTGAGGGGGVGGSGACSIMGVMLIMGGSCTGPE
jgi:hypothetical protein